MKRRDLLLSAVPVLAGVAVPDYSAFASPQTSPVVRGADQRTFWLKMLERVCRPVLASLSRGQMHALMPVESFAGHDTDRRRVTYLEAAGRTLAGIAPWLEHGPRSGPEGDLRKDFADMARMAIAVGVDNHSVDYLRFGEDRQTIVDSAFLSLALARAPGELCDQLPASTRVGLAEGLRATRQLVPLFNNWLLFSAMIEACLMQLHQPWDRLRVDYAFREHASWYLGDGTYGDGPSLHADYYNSFVIHPFLLALSDLLGKEDPAWQAMSPAILLRARRYAALQERMIAPDGSYPVIGRSICYRCGAFHLLSDIALRQILPDEVTAAQTRGALSAVIERTLEPHGTFDAEGWLQIGLAGHQPLLGETYISTGSLYLCTAAFLPLGLPSDNIFWSAPPQPWTSQRLWGGDNLPADRAI